MKGLLLKDWYLTVKYAKVLLLFLLVYTVIGVFSPEYNVFIMLPVLLTGLLPTTLYAYDEREKWLTYSQAFPISRAQYVTGKYLYGTIFFAAYLALFSILHLAAGTEDFAELFVTTFSIGLLAPSLMMPLLLRFGSEKGRIGYLVMIGAVFGVTLALTSGGNGIAGVAQLALPKWAICLAIIAIYALSWRLSIKLYQRREL